MPKSSDEFLRQSFNARNGIPQNTPINARPLSGYLVHPDSPMLVGSGPNEIESQGEIEVILRKDVAERTSYTRGDSMKTGGRLVPMTSDDEDDVSDAISNADGLNGRSAMADSVLGLLSARANKNFSGVQKSRFIDSSGGKKDSTEIIEAQILGGFGLDDIEGISYPYEKLLRESDTEPVTDIVLSLKPDDIIKSVGFTETESSVLKSKFNMGIPETPALKELRAYRKMLSVKKRLLQGTIEYVIFPRADGKNANDPRTYDKSANAWDDIEQVLISRMKREVESALSKELKNMRKDSQTKGGK